MKRSVDTPFLLLVCLLVICGLLIFTSAALGLLARNGASFTNVTVNQILLGLVCGSIALIVLSRVDYRFWRAWTPYLFALGLVLTGLTLTHFGLTVSGASRWLIIGPISFQPEEFLKFATIAFLAAIYAARYRDIKSWKTSLIPLILVTGAAGILLLLQPDTDGVVMIAGAGAAMMYAAGGRMSYLLAILCIAAVVLGVLVLTRPYVRARFETFLNPAQNAEGSGYQVQQSLIAVGSGGLLGRGFGQSVEKFSYLPEPTEDSIFAVVGEEFGFIGSSLLVLLFAAFALLGLRIASRAPDVFGGVLVVGLVVLIAGQSLLNIAGTLGLVPLAGLPLIFVSHGGTALAISLAEVGMILSVSRRMKQG